MATVETLRRLEHLARSSGSSRQAFQKSLSARRILGDHTYLGPLPIFTDSGDIARAEPPAEQSRI